MNQKKETLTTAFGAPVADDQNSITAGADGPALLQDVKLLEKLAHFNRERIPERVVHAKGAGAHGYFIVTNDLSRYTRAAFLSEVGKRTDTFVRFSTVGGGRDSADTERDPRGFAVKFYTEEGNYDLVGNNTPVFFIRDAMKFPDFIHSQKKNPATNCKDPDMFWDFLSLTPESVHQVTILFSDRGVPFSYRHMNGYGSHTFKWYNEAGEFVWVKYHIKTDQGNRTLSETEAVKLRGEDPDHATRDLYRAIEKGEFPSWTVYVQVIPPGAAMDYKWNIFDVTKVVPHSDFPLQELGKLVLNRNPENYFAEVEQAAFNPGSLVPGIAASPDKLLQGRLFGYHDAHLHRLGPNYHQIPINQSRNSPETNYQRDSYMQQGGGSGPNYWPNTMGGPAPAGPGVEEAGFDVSGHAARHPFVPADDYKQAGDLFRKVMDEPRREALVSNIVGHLKGALGRLQLRSSVMFFKADEEYGRRVAEGLGLNVARIEELAAMSHEELVKATS
ncbi:catalase [Lentisphaerota bacterium ZTH]|nr:catalase [Lentisphaerota bacterium]WET05385.1 catalase [Lentisphaerota bacterium ZTH]